MRCGEERCARLSRRAVRSPHTDCCLQAVATRRRCRDVIFLLIWLAFWGGMGYIAYQAFTLGALTSPSCARARRQRRASRMLCCAAPVKPLLSSETWTPAQHSVLWADTCRCNRHAGRARCWNLVLTHKTLQGRHHGPFSGRLLKAKPSLVVRELGPATNVAGLGLPIIAPPCRQPGPPDVRHRLVRQRVWRGQHGRRGAGPARLRKAVLPELAGPAAAQPGVPGRAQRVRGRLPRRRRPVRRGGAAVRGGPRVQARPLPPKPSTRARCSWRPAQAPATTSAAPGPSMPVVTMRA